MATAVRIRRMRVVRIAGVTRGYGHRAYGYRGYGYRAAAPRYGYRAYGPRFGYRAAASRFGYRAHGPSYGYRHHGPNYGYRHHGPRFAVGPRPRFDMPHRARPMHMMRAPHMMNRAPGARASDAGPSQELSASAVRRSAAGQKARRFFWFYDFERSAVEAA